MLVKFYIVVGLLLCIGLGGLLATGTKAPTLVPAGGSGWGSSSGRSGGVYSSGGWGFGK